MSKYLLAASIQLAGFFYTLNNLRLLVCGSRLLSTHENANVNLIMPTITSTSDFVIFHQKKTRVLHEINTPALHVFH